jgi:GTP cyclohydrolase III
VAYRAWCAFTACFVTASSSSKGNESPCDVVDHVAPSVSSIGDEDDNIRSGNNITKNNTSIDALTTVTMQLSELEKMRVSVDSLVRHLDYDNVDRRQQKQQQEQLADKIEQLEQDLAVALRENSELREKYANLLMGHG